MYLPNGRLELNHRWKDRRSHQNPNPLPMVDIHEYILNQDPESLNEQFLNLHSLIILHWTTPPSSTVPAPAAGTCPQCLVLPSSIPTHHLLPQLSMPRAYHPHEATGIHWGFAKTILLGGRKLTLESLLSHQVLGWPRKLDLTFLGLTFLQLFNGGDKSKIQHCCRGKHSAACNLPCQGQAC